jgi:hypothetical protein
MVAWVFVLEIVVILIFIPGDWTRKVIAEERVLLQSSLGIETVHWIEKKSNDWYQTTIIDSGLYKTAFHVLVPTDEERNNSRGMADMGDWWFVWVNSRIEALADVIYQFYTRTALFLIWAPYMLILLFPSIYDGLMNWRIKRSNFAYSSPVIHRYSVRFTFYLVTGLVIAFFAPITLNPIIIPVVMMACCVLVGLTVSNFQKRV